MNARTLIRRASFCREEVDEPLTRVKIIPLLMLCQVLEGLFNVAKLKKEEVEVLGKLITSSEAARLRGVSRATINYLIKNGRIKAVRMFGRVLVNRDEVLGYKPATPGPKPGGKKGKVKK